MTIRALLLGSAAALMTVTGAKAADAVMAPEPEPVEYVRVCDAYGAGFFYIPGTETCLQISGYVWYQIATTSWTNGGDTYDYQGQSHVFAYALGGPGDGWAKNIETRINFDARSETEWGTLRSYIRFNASWNGVGDGAVSADQAYIQLGGFTMGYSESFFVDAQDGGVSNYGSHSWSGMSYAYQQRALIGYTYKSSNGFIAALSLEDDAYVPAGLGEGFMPDVVAKIAYEGGWGGVWAKLAYDESDESLAGQVGAQFNIPNSPGSSLRVIGFWTEGLFNSYGALYDAGLGLPNVGAANWSVLVSYNHQFSETLGVSIAGQYFNGFQGVVVEPDAWLAELSVVWLPVTNFEVRAELAYAKTDHVAGLPAVDLDGTTSGFLRFTRYF